MRIAVYGAAGNVGRRVVRQLSSGPHTTVALIRDLSKRDELPEGCEVRQVTMPDAEQLAAATRDADALLWLTAPNTRVASVEGWYSQCTDALEHALRRNDIQRVVHISSVGAGSKQGLGTVTYAGDVEVRIDRLARHVVHLRPGYFMQNLLMNAQEIAEQGVLRLAFPPDHDMPWISSEDIATAAVQYLSDDGWAGQSYRNLMGPANLTGTELADRLALGLGRPVCYEQLPTALLRTMFETFGMSATVIDDLMALFSALGDPDGVYATARTHESVTATTIDQFVLAELRPIVGSAIQSQSMSQQFS